MLILYIFEKKERKHILKRVTPMYKCELLPDNKHLTCSRII